MAVSKKMKEKINSVLALLDEHYPTEDKCYLNYNSDYELLIATMLSAQCTDERVNMVTESLFKKYKSLEDFAAANLKELEMDIHSTGFYHNKAKNIIGACQALIERHNKIMPQDIESLTALPGVGRKTANVVRTKE